MLDKFDYEEPHCPLCGGKDFYDPEPGAPLGQIPVRRILEKLDALFGKNDQEAAGRLLVYWRDEAVSLRDRRGELSMESELVGFYRKKNDRERGLASVSRALALVDELEQGELASGATVFINCATAYKAFGDPARAMPLYRRAERLYESLLAADDPRLGGLYNNMALALADLEQTDEAEAAYRRALSVMEQIPGGEAESAITYINLSHLYESSGNTEAIAHCLKKAEQLLRSDTLPHDGYYAFVLEKCAPSFGYFGAEATYEAMIKEAKAIYEGT